MRKNNTYDELRAENINDNRPSVVANVVKESHKHRTQQEKGLYKDISESEP